MKKLIHAIYSENRVVFKLESHIGRGLKNDFWRYFPIFFENRGIVSYATNERAMALFH